MQSDLKPSDFVDTANTVIAACTSLYGFHERRHQLAEVGFTGILAPSRIGGMDLPLSFTIPLMEATGAHLLEFPLLENILVARELARDRPDLAETLCTGQAAVTIAWNGVLGPEETQVGRAPLAEQCDFVLVRRHDGLGLIVGTSSDQVGIRQAQSLDITRPEAVIGIAPEADGILLSAEAMHRIKSDALVMWSALALGSAQKCLDLACEYAQERQQFNRPLSANQAIRHYLARHCLSVETIRSAITRAISPGCPDPETAYRAAFLAATSLGSGIVEGTIQIFGGMGFTWDIPLHGHLRQIRTVAAQGEAPGILDLLGLSLIDKSIKYQAELRHAG